VTDPVRRLVAVASAFLIARLLWGNWKGRVPGTPALGLLSLFGALLLLLAASVYLRAIGLGLCAVILLLIERMIASHLRMREIVRRSFASKA